MMWNFIYLHDQFKIDVTRVTGKGRISINNLIMLLLNLHICDTYELKQLARGATYIRFLEVLIKIS